MADKKTATGELAEFTLKAVLLGVVVGIVMTAANTYLGLYAGMTVSASIPAAVISMGILRGLLRSGTIAENNIVQTIGSAGESVAAGIIFTVPALVITGVWEEFHFWPTTLIGLLGGLLGVVFMIPIRRALIVEEKELTYPEGVACAEVLEAGERGGRGIVLIGAALLVGFLMKFLVTGLGLLRGTVEGAFRVGRTAFYGGCDVSGALLAVGYIVGLNVAVLVFLGGAIGWLVAIPVYYLVHGIPTEPESLVDVMGATWSSQVRYMGVGAMIVGGLWSIFTVRHGIRKGVEGIVHGYRTRGQASRSERTDTDMPLSSVALILVPTVLAVFALYMFLTQSVAIGTTAGIVMVVAAFFFVAVSSYIVGLVGSSNNPVSGMTISTVLLTCLLLTVFGMTGPQGIIAALGVAGVVCCAACTAGDVSQDLKTGHMVRATPAKQQWGQVIGVVSAACVIAPILTLLHSQYGVGIAPPSRAAISTAVVASDDAMASEATSPESAVEPTQRTDKILRAPQANLFASIVRAFFEDGHSLPWPMVGAGALIAVVLIIIDTYLRSIGSGFRTYVMPVAVGIYLPWALGVPILLGGIAAALTARWAKPGQKTEAIHRGMLVGSGLIAGEAFMGILMALLMSLFGKEGLSAIHIELPGSWPDLLSIAMLAAILVGMVYAGLRGKATTNEG